LAHKYAQQEELWDEEKRFQEIIQESLFEMRDGQDDVQRRVREINQNFLQKSEDHLLGTNGPPNFFDPPLTDATQQAAAKQNIEILTSALDVPETVAQADPLEGLHDEGMHQYWPYFRFKAECEALLQSLAGEQTSLVSAQ
jgi:hypothetical protein